MTVCSAAIVRRAALLNRRDRRDRRDLVIGRSEPANHTPTQGYGTEVYADLG